MSNHNGSEMLNHLLKVMENYDFFDMIGKEKTAEFFQEIWSLKWKYDCNGSEILGDTGERLGICYECFNYGTLEHGVCEKCRPAM